MIFQKQFDAYFDDINPSTGTVDLQIEGINSKKRDSVTLQFDDFNTFAKLIQAASDIVNNYKVVDELGNDNIIHSYAISHFNEDTEQAFDAYKEKKFKERYPDTV